MFSFLKKIRRRCGCIYAIFYFFFKVTKCMKYEIKELWQKIKNKLEVDFDDIKVASTFIKIFITIGVSYASYLIVVFLVQAINTTKHDSDFNLVLLNFDYSGFGESFGVLAALYAGLAVILVFLTLKEQKKELQAQRKELVASRVQFNKQQQENRSHQENIEKQNREFNQYQQAENSLFQMFSVFNEISLNVKPNRYEVLRDSTLNERVSSLDSSGRDAFEKAYLVFVNACSNEYDTRGLCLEYRTPYIYINDRYGNHVAASDDDLRIIGNSYQSFWRHNRQSLGHYFRYLYRIFTVIEDAAKNGLPEDQEKKLAKVVRAQLSDYELALILYNVLSGYGQKFKPLCIKYELFNNLPRDILIDTRHLDFLHY